MGNCLYFNSQQQVPIPRVVCCYHPEVKKFKKNENEIIHIGDQVFNMYLMTERGPEPFIVDKDMVCCFNKSMHRLPNFAKRFGSKVSGVISPNDISKFQDGYFEKVYFHLRDQWDKKWIPELFRISKVVYINHNFS